uniref:Methylamine utilization protein n=1 Tax=Eiseniibacteriota bacterium TaxID=2212470 RepID=A0A832I282_UNCEI
MLAPLCALAASVTRPPRVSLRAAAALALAALCGAPFAALAPRPAAAASLAGSLALVEKGGPVREAADAVVWYVPDGGAPRPAPVRAEVQTRERRFIPRVTVVPVGSEVWFPNGDPILHNVFSVSPGNRFDLGLYRKGPGRAARFATPGLVRVYCNVHQAMVAYVVVLDTPHVARPTADGAFVLDGLPEGRGTLHVWHERTGAWSRAVSVPADGPLAITLEAAPRRPELHLDKHGRPYREDARDDDYR